MRFTVEQIFLTNPQGAPATAKPRYHLVESATVDAAVADFLASTSATLLGSVQKFPGFHAVATARADEGVFTMNVLPGSDTFHRKA